MKKIVWCFVAVLVLLGLAACSAAPETGEEKKGETDLSALSPQELYAYASEKTLSRAEVTRQTKIVLPDGEIKEIKTVRIKDGYDGFSYSRTGFGEEIWFLSSTAYVRSSLGSYSSPMSARVFQEYLNEAFFPTGLAASFTQSVEKWEKGVDYTIKQDAAALFALSLSQGTFVPEEVSGKAEIDDAGLIWKEEILVKGSLAGEAATYRIETETVFEAETISLPASESFAQLGDVRIPARITRGAEKLLQNQNQEITLLVNAALSGTRAFSYYEETVLTATENGEYYLRGQDLKKQPEKEDVATYFQALVKGEVALENRYDLKKGEMISEGTLSEKDTALKQLLSQNLPPLSGLKTVELQEDLRQDTVIFTVADAMAEEIWKEFSAMFPEAGLPAALSDVEATGVYTFSKDGKIEAFSIALGGTANGERFSYQISLTPRSVSNPSLPDALTLPEYIDPSHGGIDG